jgi:hypothetical protein
MMAMENLAEWRWTGYIEVETVRAAIDAYEAGLIELPPVPEKTRKGLIRPHRDDPESIPDHPYTMKTVAEFLGWTNRNKAGFEPNDACVVAFMAIDALADGLVKAAEIQDLKREQMMAHENLEEWEASGWVQLETVRAVLWAAEQGLIQLPEPDKHDTSKRYEITVLGSTSTQWYTHFSIAKFLGCPRPARSARMRHSTMPSPNSVIAATSPPMSWPGSCGRWTRGRGGVGIGGVKRRNQYRRSAVLIATRPRPPRPPPRSGPRPVRSSGFV